MRIGFIGDIVGRPGRKIIKENLIKIKKLQQTENLTLLLPE